MYILFKKSIILVQLNYFIDELLKREYQRQLLSTPLEVNNEQV